MLAMMFMPVERKKILTTLLLVRIYPLSGNMAGKHVIQVVSVRPMTKPATIAMTIICFRADFFNV